MECITSANKATKPEGFIFDIGSLYSYLSRVSDSRKPKGVRYPLALILTLMVLAKLCGQDRPSGIAEWAQQRTEVLVQALHLKRERMPHHSTYRRILEEVIFEKLVSQFLKSRPKAGRSVVIVMDGKTLRGTIPSATQRGLHLLGLIYQLRNWC